jgi:5-methylcytosine-specific restriction protein A
MHRAHLEWDKVLAPDERIPVEELRRALPDAKWDRMQASGIEIPGPTAERLERLWANHNQEPFRAAEELPPGQSYPESSAVRVEVNRYERNPQARTACLDRWGHRCVVCDLDFEERYGALGRGFIHVHHLTDLSTVGPDYKVNPIQDLRPVCANCHAMLHYGHRPALPIEDLKQFLSGDA